MAKNSNLHNAKTAKNDEFYTQLTDIEKELKHYKKHLNFTDIGRINQLEIKKD